jgi:hypothetical protein
MERMREKEKDGENERLESCREGWRDNVSMRE